MHKDFTLTKEDKYHKLTYLGYEPESVVFDIHHPDWTYVENEEEGLKLIDAIVKLEEDMSKLMKEREIKHDPKKIIRFYFIRLENILIGIDVRAKWSWEKKVEAYVEWFDGRYNDADEFCNTVYETVKEFNPVESNNWRTYEKYDRLRKMFSLDYPDLKEFFGKDPFDKLIETLDDINLKISLYQKKMKSYGL